MKTHTINNFIGMMLAFFVMLGGMFVMTQTVSAAASFTGAQFPVTIAANHSVDPQGENWYDEGVTYASISAGQRASVAVYYHNTGTSPANNVRIRLTPQNTSSSTQHVFTGSIMSTNTNPISGSVTIGINGSAQSLQHVSSTGNHQRANGVSTNFNSTQYAQLFSSTGINIGTVQPGDSGAIVVHFTTPTQSNEPTLEGLFAQTLPPEFVSETSAQLRGNYDGDGEEVAVRFQYSTSLNNLLSGSGTSVSWISQGTGSGLATRTANNLQPNTTYYYQICVRYVDNPHISICDPHASFTTHGAQDTLSLNTQNANPVQETSARLRGNIVEGNDVTVWFALTTGSNPSCTSSSQRQNVNGSFDEGDTINLNVTNLQDNTTYNYRICGELSSGITGEGQIRSFTTEDEYVAPSDGLSIITQNPNQIQTTSARLNGRVQSGNNIDVWFALTTGSNPSCTSSSQRQNVNGSFDEGDTINLNVTNLQDNTTYNYRICGELSSGITGEGQIRSFTTEDEYVAPSDGLSIITQNPNQVQTTSARLNGRVQSGNNIDVWFALTTGSNPSCTSSSQRYNVTGAHYAGDSFSRNVSGLSSNTLYRYRACGETQSGVINNGAIRSFTTNSFPTITPEPEEDAVVSACSVVSVGTGIATVRAAYTSDTSGTGYFQYGTGGSFTSSTSSINVSGTGIDQRVLTGLQPGTTYSCRYIVINDAGSSFGQATSFTTNQPVAVGGGGSTTTTTTTIISSGEGRLVTLVIDNDQEIAYRGQLARYVVEYGNISGRDLDQVGLLVRLPKAARFIASNQGTYNRRDHTVYYRIGTFREDQEGIMTIDVRIGGANNGEPIVAEAILAFENPIDNAQNAFINAIEFDADTYSSGVGLGAGLFGFGFPSTLAEWILFLLIIIGIILLARYMYNRNKERNARIAMMQAQERAHQAKINEDMMRNGNGGYGNSNQYSNGSQYNN